MNITKGLKVKKRIAGEVARLQRLIQTENSRRVDQKTKQDVPNLFIELEHNIYDLTRLKASLNRASAPIADKLVGLSELKGQIPFYNGLTTREGIERINGYSATSMVEIEYETSLNRVQVEDKIASLQHSINGMQDEIDEFNAITKIDVEV
jgi:hypothetical protein